MLAPNPRLVELSEADRQELEFWLVDFDRRWDDGLLSDRVGRIPPGRSWRLPALVEMIKIDLERQWQKGRRVDLESYLRAYPELGGPDDVSLDLIQAEYEVRRQFGATVAEEDYVRRFPHRANELRRWIEEEGPATPARRLPGTPRSGTRRTSASQSRALPEMFGRYRILRRLGEGGMGSVYLAEDTELGRQVALKVSHVEVDESPEYRERFTREARAAATLDHPYLCPVYDIGTIEGIHYLTMAYIPGRSLATAIPDEGLPPRQVAALVGKLALALQEAHARGVIHRDLKPSNVMLKEAGGRREPVIVDFGLARREDVADGRVTRTGQALGTPAYMSPEQIHGDPREIGPSCDIYALGVILYELLTGRLPFQGPPLSVAGQILTQEPEPPSAIRPGLDPRIEAICLKAMAKQTKARFASMAELASSLKDFLQHSSPTGPDASQVSGISTRGIEPRGPEADSSIGPFPGQAAKDKVATGDASPEDPSAWDPSRGGRRMPWIILAASSTFMIVLGVGIYLATNEGRIRIEVDDPKAVLLIDDSSRPETPGEPIRLRAGKHRLTIRWKDGATESQTFAILRGEERRWPIKRQRPEEPGIITNSLGMKLVRIPAGEFLMGSYDSEPGSNEDERPKHRVRISTRFYLSQNEVTQPQYYEVMWENPSRFKKKSAWHPVESVTWFEAIRFCNALSKRERLPAYYRIAGAEVTILGGEGYRLPTEAEWEYACRAGSTRSYCYGDDPSELGRHAWYYPNTHGSTHPVRVKQSNAWGLHDMHGNVWEWCWDWHDDTSNYYEHSPRIDPTGPPRGTSRILRGGAWGTRWPNVRSATRAWHPPEFRADHLGIRVARTPPT